MKNRAWAFLFPCAITCAAWGGVLWGTFHYDDYANVIRDPATTDGAALLTRLLHGIRPLLRASYALDHAVWGFRAGGFLLTNLLLHVVTVLGVLALARARLRDELAAMLAATVFALQPAHSEVVAYVSGRSTGLAVALLVAGLAVNAGAFAVRPRWRALLAGALFVLACLAKEIAVVFPALVFLWERGRGPEEEPGALSPRAALVLAAVPFLAIAASPRARELLAYSFTLRGPAESLALNLRALPEMLSLWFRPGSLSILQPIEDWGLLAGAAVALVLAGVCLFGHSRAPLLALAAGWILVSLAPTGSVIAKIETVTAKPLYLAWIGPSLLAGALLARALRHRSRPFARGALGAAACALVVATLLVAREVRVWTREEAFWSRATRRAPEDAVGWTNLGAALSSANRSEEAIAAWTRALELDPTSLRARSNLILAAARCGDRCNPKE